jgi:ankyrin repeat protein
MKHPYLEPVGWAITTNHCPLVNTLFKIDPTFDPSKYFEDAGEWFFEDKINTYISADMLERLEYCSQDIWDSKSIPGQGWLYSRMLNACRRGNLDVLRLCVPEVFKLSSVVSPSYPWYQISGHLMLEAAANNQLEIVEHFSQQYGAMNLREEFRSFTSIHDGNVYNALERTALSGHLEIAVLLRKQGWKPLSLLNYGAKDGITRLDQAARQGNFHIVAALLEVLKLDWIDIGYDHLEMGKLNAFISAASEGHEFVVRACRKYGLNPLQADQGGMCAFMRAIRNGRYKVVEYLLTPDPDVRAEACGVRANVEGLPLSLAASMGHMDIAELLLKNGADAFSTSSNAVDLIYSDLVPIIDMSPTPLYAASANGHKAMVEFLLVHGAGPDSLSPTGVLSQSTDPRYRKNGLTRRRIFYSDKRAYEIRDITAKIDVAHWQRPLAGAAVNGQLEVVKTLLQTDIDINAKDSNQDTALFLAAALGHKEIMRELLDAGATTTDFTVHATAVRQLLMCAADPDRVEGLRCLLELGTHPDNLSAEGQTALFNAVTTGSPLAASILLEAGAEIDFRDFKHNTALSAACNHSNVVAASLLIDAKADVNAENAQGQSILLQACRKATMEIVQLLVARGASTNSTDVRNYTPLFAACERGHAGIVKVLLANHAEVNYKLPYRGSNETSDGAEILAWPKWTTPLMVAAMKGWKNIIEMLVAKGTDLEAVDATERTAVMSAAILGRTREVGVLIRHGASIKRRNKHGRGLLSMAVEAKSFELVSYLLSLHYSALEQTPPRLLFSSRDSGQALEYANANFELGVFQRGVDEILKHYGHAREYQKKHQSRYKGVEMEDLRKKWSKNTPVAPEDEAPYDLVRQIQATAEALQEFKTAHKEGAQDLIDATINGTNSLEETYAAGIGARR